MILHGTFTDASYGTLDMFDGMEEFSSIRAAKCALRERYESNGHTTCGVTRLEFSDDRSEYERHKESVLFPAVTRGAMIDLYIPGQYDYPEKRLTFGPRGGVRVEDC